MIKFTNKIKRELVQVSENDALIKQSYILDKAFYLWFDSQCNESQKTYGKDLIHESNQADIYFEMILNRGLVIFEIRIQNKDTNSIITSLKATERISVNKLYNMTLSEIVEKINNGIMLIL